jgi:hypothetical protein
MLNKQNEKLLQELLKKYKQGIISGLYPGNNITFTPTGCRDKIISSTGGGAGGGIESIQEGDNITIDDTDPQNPIISAKGGGSSALLPNGVKYLTESRDLQADDAGYILFLLSETEPVVLTIPEISPLQVGDNFEIILAESGDWQNSGFIWSGVLLKPEITESVFFTTTTFEGNPYSLAISTLFTEGKTAFKYLYDQLQNAIPLSGTVSGSPVTGDIEVGGGIDQFYLGLNDASEAGLNSKFYIDGSTVGIYNETIGNYKSSFSVNSEIGGTLDCDNPISKGLSGIQDFTPNITDLDYTQKIYVDSAVNAIRPYKVYTAIITQTGTDAPTAVVLQNTLGITPTLTRFATGNYRITASNTFTANKTFCIVGQEANSGTGMNYIWASDSNDDEVLLQTYDGAGLGAALTDDKMDRLSVEIRVYK